MLQNTVLWRTPGRRGLLKCPFEPAENAWEEREKMRGERKSERASETEAGMRTASQNWNDILMYRGIIS